MKRLLLVRHAKSSWNNPSLHDFDRPLNKRGFRDAPFMGQRLAALDNMPTRIITSPAKRAFATAAIIAQKMAIQEKQITTDENLYLADRSTILDLIKGLDNKLHEILIVGHNPGMTDLANHLQNDPIDNIPTCGLFCLDFEVSSWQTITRGSGRLLFFDYPKKHF